LQQGITGQEECPGLKSSSIQILLHSRRKFNNPLKIIGKYFQMKKISWK
jgi:hypothetical protein